MTIDQTTFLSTYILFKSSLENWAAKEEADLGFYITGSAWVHATY